MTAAKHHITVYEHDALKIGQGLSESQLHALQAFHGERGVPYYSLIHQGVKFKEYVGVLQIGSLVIEVLPKADKGHDQNYWRQVLLAMLKGSGIMNLTAPSYSDLHIRKHSILELYFEIFAAELQSLINRGLAKKYRKHEGNVNCYKGQVIFAKQIRLNVIHQERVYSRYTVFDVDHTIHQILYKALKLVANISTSPSLHGKLGDLLLRFPEVANIQVNEQLFNRIHLGRNTVHYKNALDIAKLMLLNFHPDILRGTNHVLALMFDMNVLWEKFVYQSLHSQLGKLIPGIVIRAQYHKSFWRPEGGSNTSVIPDIFIQHPNEKAFVIDTKWKNLDFVSPSNEDLRQLFVYHEYYTAEKVSIIYPGDNPIIRKGRYQAPSPNYDWNKECALIALPVNANIQKWQSDIAQRALEWMEGD